MRGNTWSTPVRVTSMASARLPSSTMPSCCAAAGVMASGAFTPARKVASSAVTTTRASHGLTVAGAAGGGIARSHGRVRRRSATCGSRVVNGPDALGGG